MDLSKLHIPQKPHIRLVNGRWKVVNDSSFQARFRYPNINRRFFDAIAWCRRQNNFNYFNKLSTEQLIMRLMEITCGDE